MSRETKKTKEILNWFGSGMAFGIILLMLALIFFNQGFCR